MNFVSRHPLLTAAIFLVAVFLAFIFWQAMTIRNESESHEYHYSVSVSTPSVLENCTLLLPVPFIRNTSPLGEAMVRGDVYNVPPDWRLSLEQVNDTPMLKISAPAIIPEYHGYPIPLEWGSTPPVAPPPVATTWADETPVLIPWVFSVSLKVQDSVDTRDPVGREPLLSDPSFYTPAPCRGPSSSGYCYRSVVPVYVICSSGAGGNLTLSISGGGTNQWWLGGWSGKSYGETMEVPVEDTMQGWIQGEGFLSTGMGRY
jgi:hypothetical protein